MTRRLGLAGLVVFLCSGAPASAQTTSAHDDSLEVSRRADGLLAADQPDRAARLYRRALAIDETNLSAYLGLSEVLARRGEHAAALALLGDAQSLLGWSAELGLQRGIQLFRLGRWSECIDTLAPVRARLPNSFRAAYFAAGAHLELGHWQAAVDDFSAYLAARPAALADRDIEVHNRRALALLQLGQHRQARRETDAVLATAPGNRPARVLRFTALAKAGDCRSALALFTELESLAPVAPTLLYDAAVCQFRLGQGRAALASLDAHDRYQRAPTREPLLRARIHASLGDAAQAEASYRAALAAGLPVATELAAWLEQRGERDQAVALLWPLVEQGSRDPALLELAATVLRDAAQWDRARLVASRLAEVRPDAASWRLVGDIEKGRRDWPAAGTAYQRAVELDPGDRAAAVGLGLSLFEQASVAVHAARRDQARELLERAHRADPSAAAITYDLALLELADHPRRTIELLEPGLSGAAPRAQLVAGRAYYAVGDHDAARRAFALVADRNDADPKLRVLAHAQLGHLLAASDAEQALAHIDRARALGGAAASRPLALDQAEATARLAIAEQALRHREPRQLRDALARVSGEQLPAADRVRLRLLQLYRDAESAGIAASLRALAAIGDDDLAAIEAGALPLPSLRHALALLLTGHALHRSRDFTRQLRPHAVALAKEPAAAALLTGWYDHLLAATLAEPNHRALARTLARAVPRAATSRSLRHNAIVAGALANPAARRLTPVQRRELDQLAAGLPEALINLALASEARGDQTAALDYLRRIPAPRRSPAVTEWLRWKELLYAAP